MTPAEIYQACLDLRTKVGPRAYVALDITVHGSAAEPIQAVLYPRGIVHDDCLRAGAGGWQEAIDKVTALWEEAAERLDAEALRNMALTIIKMTDNSGSCTEASLRMEGFSQDEIDRYGTAACEKANEMADLGPFTITALSGANAA